MASIQGYCTVEDVRGVFQDTSFSGALSDNNNITVQKAIGAQTEWVEKATKKHWYVSGGVSPDKRDIVFTSVKTRDDEYALPTHGGYVDGAYGGEPYRATNTSNTVFSAEQSASPDPKKQIRLDRGDLDDDTVPAYTRIQLARKDVDAVNKLHVANATGGYDDWVGSNDYDGGVGFDSHAGDDFYVRINSGGVSELYIDVHSLDDDIAYLSNALIVDIDYGDNELPQSIRQAVAKLSAEWLVNDDEFRTMIPDNGQLQGLESKAQAWKEQALRTLRPWIEDLDKIPFEDL